MSKLAIVATIKTAPGKRDEAKQDAAGLQVSLTGVRCDIAE
jgi:hypothetical protein